MSLWTIERADGRVKLTFVHEPLAARPLVEACGEAEAALESDLAAWVFEQAAPWDFVRTPGGTFVRQYPVAQHAPRSDAAPGSWATAREGSA